MNYLSGEHVVIYPDTIIGSNSVLGDHAIVGKQPVLSAQSTAQRNSLPPLQIGNSCTISAGAIVFAGTILESKVIVGDQACIRERCKVGNNSVIGRGSLIENDSIIGTGVKIQSNSYITAYTTIENDVFIGPCVTTTNDNFMGRTEKRHELRCGPTIRHGARIGGGAVILPGIEIGAESFIGAGAVVTKDVAPGTIVVGNPARFLRNVPAEEKLDITD
tara:strand:- start:21 stop:674 length:654 start_codon:yes stop_codon:yes gene_type:complete